MTNSTSATLLTVGSRANVGRDLLPADSSSGATSRCCPSGERDGHGVVCGTSALAVAMVVESRPEPSQRATVLGRVNSFAFVG